MSFSITVSIKRTLVLVTTFVVASPHSIQAQAITTGGGAFVASGVLPIMPCSNCPASFSGTMAVTIEGVDQSGAPYQATWPDPSVNPAGANLTATLVYSDDCGVTAGTPPSATGFADGSFTVTGGLLVRPGGVSHQARLTGDVFWNRVGAALVLDISGTDVYDGSGALVATTANPNDPLLDGAGTAAYEPSTWMGNCIDFASNVTVLMAGTLTQTM